MTTQNVSSNPAPNKAEIAILGAQKTEPAAKPITKKITQEVIEKFKTLQFNEATLKLVLSDKNVAQEIDHALGFPLHLVNAEVATNEDIVVMTALARKGHVPLALDEKQIKELYGRAKIVLQVRGQYEDAQTIARVMTSDAIAKRRIDPMVQEEAGKLAREIQKPVLQVDLQKAREKALQLMELYVSLLAKSPVSPMLPVINSLIYYYTSRILWQKSAKDPSSQSTQAFAETVNIQVREQIAGIERKKLELLKLLGERIKEASGELRVKNIFLGVQAFITSIESPEDTAPYVKPFNFSPFEQVAVINQKKQELLKGIEAEIKQSQNEAHQKILRELLTKISPLNDPATISLQVDGANSMIQEQISLRKQNLRKSIEEQIGNLKSKPEEPAKNALLELLGMMKSLDS